MSEIQILAKVARLCETAVMLSPDQTDRQVVASGRQLNFRRDLRCVAKRTSKSRHKYTLVAKETISKQTYLVFHWLLIG